MQSRDKYNPFRARYERLGKRPKDSTGDPYNLKYRQQGYKPKRSEPKESKK